jgi:hypothetical protein
VFLLPIVVVFLAMVVVFLPVMVVVFLLVMEVLPVISESVVLLGSIFFGLRRRQCLFFYHCTLPMIWVTYCKHCIC